MSCLSTFARIRRFFSFIGLGLLAFALTHVFFSLTWDSFNRWGGYKYGAWFLNARNSMVFMSLVLFITAFLTSLRAATTAWDRFICGFGILFGAMVAMTATLFIIGPGNLWPLVIILGTGLITVSVFLGVIASALVMYLHRRRPEA